jgi:hypothetical protein
MDFLDKKYIALNPIYMNNPSMSYSGYKVSDVKKKFEESLKKKSADDATFWAIELHLSNQIILLLSVIKSFVFHNCDVINFHFLHHLYSFQKYY